MIRRQYDVGLIIPLKEEFGYIKELAPVLETISFAGTFFHVLDFGDVSVVSAIVGEMGPLPACQTTTRLLQFADVKAVFLVGLAGSLDADVCIGDVIIADRVTEYLANSKAIPDGERYSLVHGGRHWPQEFKIRECIKQVDIVAPDSFQTWNSYTKKDFEELDIPEKEKIANNPARYHVGSLASGDIVGASTAFVETLKAMDRKFLALDMEAAGVQKATSDTVNPIPTIVIRGISDRADEQKKLIDRESNGPWRKYCVRSAASFLELLLHWPEFLFCIGIKKDQQEQEESILPVMASLSDSPGNLWMVGVSLGIHTYAPYPECNGSVSPKPITHIRTVDEKADELFHHVYELGKSIRLNEQPANVTAQSICDFVDAYRDIVGNVPIDIMLSEFDAVVRTILSSENSGGMIEQVLPLTDIDAAIGEKSYKEARRLLSGLDESNPDVRQRLVAIDFGTKNYPAVIGRLENRQPNMLMRQELENLITSAAIQNDKQKANYWLDVHKRKYNDRPARLFCRHIRTTYLLNERTDLDTS